MPWHCVRQELPLAVDNEKYLSPHSREDFQGPPNQQVPPQLVLIQVVNGQRLSPLRQNLLLLLSLGLPLPTLPLCLKGVVSRDTWLELAPL